MPRRTSTPWSRCSSAHHPPSSGPSGSIGCGGDVDERHVEVLLARGLGHLATDEAGAHDHDPRPLVERRPERERVIEVTQHVDAIQIGAEPRPASRPRAGGEDQTVVLDLVAVGEHDPPARPIQASRRRAKPPLGLQLVAGELDPIDRVLAGQELLRQWRPGVWPVVLLADHHQLAVEFGFPCGLRRAQPGQRGPDDDQAAHRLVVDQADRVLRAGALDLFGELAHVLRDLDRVAAADRHVALVVAAQQLRGERVTAPVALACGR